MRYLAMLAASAALISAPPAVAQSLKPGEVFSSIAVRPISEPNPVRGADGRVHLAYELLVVNPSRVFVTLDKVEAVDSGSRVLSSLEGDRLAAMASIYGGTGRVLAPGGSAAVFMDVSFGDGEALPADLAARITATRQEAGADGKPAPMPADSPVPAAFTFTGANAAVGKSAIVVEPPLEGNGWVAVNGCCDAITSHRGAVMAINGVLRVPERFAIDWVKLDGSGRLFTGDVSKLESYHYGRRSTPLGGVWSISMTAPTIGAGRRVKAHHRNIGGNMLVVDIGDGASSTRICGVAASR